MHRVNAIRDTLSGRHLVVTGATGFVGKVWLAHLLTTVPDVGRVTLLVRGTRREPAQHRVARMIDTSPAFRPLRDAVPQDLGAWLDARIEVIDADITRPHCGLDHDTRERLAATADALVHIAGLTDFQPDPRKGLPANVDGTRHAARLASTFRFPRMVHVSTAFVAGMRGGEIAEALIPGVSPLGVPFDVDEEIAHAHALCAEVAEVDQRIEQLAARAKGLGWPNLYTYSKGLAEHLLAHMPVDVTIVRPTVVECARTFPFPGWNEGLNTSGPILWFCGTAFRALPANARHRFDVVPVDAIARALTVVLARHLNGVAEPIHHVGTSANNPATFERIVELSALAKRRHASRASATVWERLEAMVDVVPRTVDETPYVDPARVEAWGRDLHGWLTRLDVKGRWTGLGSLGEAIDKRVHTARKDLAKQNRRMGQLRKMLDAYKPFLHDHDWIFRSDAIQRANRELHPDDRADFLDDLSTLDWRHYWLDVQYPGIVKWAFPLMDNREAPLDPPSHPPLALGVHDLEVRRAERAQGVA